MQIGSQVYINIKLTDFLNNSLSQETENWYKYATEGKVGGWSSSSNRICMAQRFLSGGYYCFRGRRRQLESAAMAGDASDKCVGEGDCCSRGGEEKHDFPGYVRLALCVYVYTSIMA